MNISTNHDAFTFTEENFAEIEAQAEDRGELLFQSIELGTDVKFSSILGDVCDRFIK